MTDELLLLLMGFAFGFMVGAVFVIGLTLRKMMEDGSGR